MNIQEVIIKKKNKEELSKEEIDFFVKGYTNGSITDYHAAALIMAIYLNGMNARETLDLTMSMVNSGDVIDLSDVANLIVDKHSTGGVGDKMTLVLMPIIASLGIPVAKLSGRGLGFTGGTIDKLESIPGYQTGISQEELKRNVKEIGISIMGPTMNFVPADKKIYSLRDAIGCVDSLPLIASSIMSKKIASGANKLVLEVTCGSGAFMETKEDAILLAKQMIAIGKLAGKEMVCVLTNMNQPLGRTIGNSLEIIEVTQSLQGNIAPDVKEVACKLGSYILKLAGKGDNLEENEAKIWQQIENGKAYEKWKELVAKQGGDVAYVENTSLFPQALHEIPIISDVSGYIEQENAKELGEASVLLGAGRIKKEDSVEKEAGIVLYKKVGDYVEAGEKIASVYTNHEEFEMEIQKIKNAFSVTAEPVQKPEEILGIVQDI